MYVEIIGIRLLRLNADCMIRIRTVRISASFFLPLSLWKQN